MGRIKSTLIKRTSRELISEENALNEDFENNKRLLGDSMPSKSVRNKIAGYIGRLKKQKNSTTEK